MFLQIYVDRSTLNDRTIIEETETVEVPYPFFLWINHMRIADLNGLILASLDFSIYRHVDEI